MARRLCIRGYVTPIVTNEVDESNFEDQELAARVLSLGIFQSSTQEENLNFVVMFRLDDPLMGSSEATRLQDLLSKDELGNENPSDLLRRVKRLLGDKYATFDQFILLHLFYQRLPPRLCSIAPTVLLHDQAMQEGTFHHNYDTDFTSQFTTDIRYVRGENNCPADALSRNISATSTSLIDFAAIAADQADDTELQRLMENPALQMKMAQLPGINTHLYADVSTDTIRLYLPQNYRYPLFRHIHDLSHTAISLRDISTDRVAKAFIITWISRFDTHLSLTFDRGRRFEYNLWNNIMPLLGIRRFRTASYHPQSNGLVEHFHRQSKASIAATARDRTDWSTVLPVVLGIRTSFKEDLDHSSAELLYGTPLRLRGVKKPLQQLYDGPYRVTKRTKKNLTINRSGTTDVISMDCANPANLLSDNTQDPVGLPTPPDTQSTNHKHTTKKKQISFLLPRH
ncbi:uncharacterized protein LOC143036105 [Oratosquilla oratoria]|uniref:uncharacterized protein LOC143036105 n=1 Tax=Oratosquilla oratoria TaxID=337810 RepID=UPI003F77649F